MDISMRALSLVLLAALSTAAAQDKSAAPPLTINETMAQIGEVMVGLFPLIVAKQELNAAQQATVREDVARLVELFRQASPAIQQRAETYQVSYQLVINYLEGVQRSLVNEDFDRGRAELYGLGPICASCHTQDTRLRTFFIGAGRARFPDDFSFAEFNYLTRNYDEAERYYDIYLSSPQPQTELDIIQPLQRLVTIYTQIRNQPGRGAEKLKQYGAVKAHTDETKKQLQGWIDGMDTLAKSGLSSVTQPDIKALAGYVSRYVGDLDKPLPVHVAPEQEVARVWLRGQLYRYLADRASPDQVPNLLYWLAVTDRAIGYDYYFSLPDLYLKDCVFNYAQSPLAQRCFAEFKEYVGYAYSGSSGEFVPPEVEAELEQMQRALRDASR